MDVSHVYVRALALGCFYSQISTLTFRRALTASLDSCVEIKECPFSGVTKSGRVWRKVPESDARSVGLHVSRYPVPSPLVLWRDELRAALGKKQRALCWCRATVGTSRAGCHYLLPCEPEAVMRNPSFVLITTITQKQVITQKLPATDPHARTRSVICLPYCRRTFSCCCFLLFFFLKNFRKNRFSFVSVF